MPPVPTASKVVRPVTRWLIDPNDPIPSYVGNAKTQLMHALTASAASSRSQNETLGNIAKAVVDPREQDIVQTVGLIDTRCPMLGETCRRQR